MIEPTDEMRRTLMGFFPMGHESSFMPALAAVLAIVERDNWVVPHAAWPPWEGAEVACNRCGSPLQPCVEAECGRPSQCGDVWCIEHTPDGTP